MRSKVKLRITLDVLRKLLDRKVWEHPNLWGNFKLLIKDYPSSFLKLMKEVPHGTRQLFYDEYPRLKASDRDRKDPKSKPRYPYKKWNLLMKQIYPETSSFPSLLHLLPSYIPLLSKESQHFIAKNSEHKRIEKEALFPLNNLSLCNDE